MGSLFEIEQLKNSLKSQQVKDLGNHVYEVEQSGTRIILEVLNVDIPEKKLQIRHNHVTYALEFKTSLDRVLDNMGLKRSVNGSGGMVQAPMPGKILDVVVEIGSEVSAGDPLLVLEAMKMENVLKAETDGVIEEVGAAVGDHVDKGQTLLKIKAAN